ncbi:cellulose binding domain-containing protein, partial [Microbispora rosea]
MSTFRRRAAALITSAAAVLTGALTWVAGAAPADAATGCAVTYRITNQWPGGFGADVTVTNLGDTISGWTLGWSFTSGQQISQAWNATVTQTGAAVTAGNVDYNRTIASNASVNFGFNGSWNSANPAPASFTLNGVTCTGGVTSTPSASPTRFPSPSPSASPSPSPSSSPRPSPTPSPTPAPGRITVWLAGDSTVANSSGAPIVGWGRELGQYLTTGATVVNNAVGGRSIQTWLYESAVTDRMNSTGECALSSTAYASRWQSMLDASTGMKAGDYLFIQFGINDGSPTCPRHVGAARYRELLTTMVRAAQQRGANPVLVTPVA